MKEYLSFRKMITPVFIQVLFWIGVALCVIMGLVSIIGGAAARYGGGARVLAGLLTIILGPIFVRVYCELIMIMFRIYDVLLDIREGRRSAPTAAPTAPPQQPTP